MRYVLSPAKEVSHNGEKVGDGGSGGGGGRVELFKDILTVCKPAGSTRGTSPLFTHLREEASQITTLGTHVEKET